MTEDEIKVETRTEKEEYIPGESVRMTVSIINRGPTPVELNFASSQRYDFIVYKNELGIWQWSRDKMFSQVIGSLRLNPSERRSYRETWTAAPDPGSYQLVGVIASLPAHNARCAFRIGKKPK